MNNSANWEHANWEHDNMQNYEKKNEKSTLNLTIWPKSIWKHQNICKHVLTHKQKYDQLLNKEQTWSIFHAEVEPKLESYASVKF